MTPHRIQRRRTRGWRMPAGAVCVGRPSRWGNPFKIGVHVVTPAEAVARYDAWLMGLPFAERRALLAPLVGQDLVCWCPLDQPCHADTLLAATAAWWDCRDCGIDTTDPDFYQYYMVDDPVWRRAVPDQGGMLCLACLSDRLGRPLAMNDFRLTPKMLRARLRASYAPLPLFPEGFADR